MRPSGALGTFGTLIVGIVLGAAGTLLLISRVPLDKRADEAVAVVGTTPPATPATLPEAANVPAATASPAPAAAADNRTAAASAGGTATPGDAPGNNNAAPAASAPAPAVPGAGKAAGDSLAGMRSGDTSGTGGLVASGGGSSLLVPVAGVKPSQLQDTYSQPRGSERMHEALGGRIRMTVEDQDVFGHRRTQRCASGAGSA